MVQIKERRDAKRDENIRNPEFQTLLKRGHETMHVAGMMIEAEGVSMKLGSLPPGLASKVLDLLHDAYVMHLSDAEVT